MQVWRSSTKMPDSELYYVLDNVLTDDQVNKVRSFSDDTIRGRLNVIYLPKDCSAVEPLIEKARNYFDLSSSLYYEVWEQKNTLPEGNNNMGWHYDDDVVLQKYNIVKYPLCTTVYYLDIDRNLLDGKLVIQNPVTSKLHYVQPKSNRLVIFGPGIYHTVEEFTGYRHSIICNPWDRPLGLIDAGLAIW